MDITVEDIPQEPSDRVPEPATQTERVEHLILAPQFRIDSPTNEDKGKLAEVWALGKQLSKTGETHDVIWQVKHLMMTLGAPTPGESSLDRIYRYAKLKRQIRQAETELKYLWASSYLLFTKKVARDTTFPLKLQQKPLN